MSENIDGYTYFKKDFLGGGVFGEVFKGKDNRGQKDIAIKKVRLPEPHLRHDREVMKYIEGEKIALRKVAHPNIVELYHVKEEGDFIYFMTELCDFNLDSYFKNAEVLSLNGCLQMMSEMSQAVSYLHRIKPEPFLHRDIKSQNILLKISGNGVVVKVADLGLARQVMGDLSKVDASAVGSQNYMAPEMWPNKHGKVQYYTGVDVFALGIVFLAMLQASPKENLKPIKGGEDGSISLGQWMSINSLQGVTVKPQVNISVGDDETDEHLADLIIRMLRQNPKHRTRCDSVAAELQFIKDMQPMTAASSLPEIEGAVGGLSLHEAGSQSGAISTEFLPRKDAKYIQPTTAASSLPEIEGAIGGLSLHKGGSQSIAVPTNFLPNAKLQFSKLCSYNQVKDAYCRVGISSHGELISRTGNSFIKYQYTGKDFKVIYEKEIPAHIVRRCGIRIHNDGRVFVSVIGEDCRIEECSYEYTADLALAAKHEHQGKALYTILDDGKFGFATKKDGKWCVLNSEKDGAELYLMAPAGTTWGAYFSACSVGNLFIVTEQQSQTMSVFDQNGKLISSTKLDNPPFTNHALTHCGPHHAVVRSSQSLHIHALPSGECIHTVSQQQLGLENEEYIEAIRSIARGVLIMVTSKRGPRTTDAWENAKLTLQSYQMS